MTSAGVAELKAQLSRYLTAVKAGEEVLITDRGRPVARLVPPSGGSAASDEEELGRLQQLAREGLVRMPEAEITEEFWAMDRPEDPASSVREALIDERSSGR